MRPALAWSRDRVPGNGWRKSRRTELSFLPCRAVLQGQRAGQAAPDVGERALPAVTISDRKFEKLAENPTDLVISAR